MKPEDPDEADNGNRHNKAHPPFARRQGHSARQPMFNLPSVILLMLAMFVVVHVLRLYVMSPQAGLELLLYCGFIPERFSVPPAGLVDTLTLYLSPVTYSFLHGSWMHLALNSFWLIAFGTPVARRFGPSRFWALAFITSMGGALAHFFTHLGELAPMIGASAIVSGMMGASARFIFNGHAAFGQPGVENFPASSLVDSFTNRQFLVFIGVWLGLNYLFGAGIDMSGQATVAWQAHIGGFLAGILLFSWLDPGTGGRRTIF